MWCRTVKNFVFLTNSLNKIPIRTCIIHKETSGNVLNKSTTIIKANNDNLPEYTEEQQTRILHQLNVLNIEEFQSYNITKGRASKLVAWKNRNGPLKTIADVQFIDGFGRKVVEKFFESLLNEPGSKQTKKATRPRMALYVTPNLDDVKRKKIQSCVSLRIGVSSVTWSRLELAPDEQNEPCTLTHWQHHEILEKKLHLVDLIQRCLYVDHLIPQADCYIFETPQMAQIVTNPGSAEQQNISIQKSQVAAILSFAMAKRADIEMTTEQRLGGTHVYYLRRFLSARLFNHLVGTERVSSEQTVMNMMRTHYNFIDTTSTTTTDSYSDSTQSTASEHELKSKEICLKDTVRGNVEFPRDLRQTFAQAERYQREFLGQALLMNLTFVRLALLQDPQSVAAVSRQSKKDKDISKEEE